MFSVNRSSTRPQASHPAVFLRAFWAALCVVAFCVSAAFADPPGGKKLVLPVPNADAKTEKEMKPYTDIISGTKSTFDMVPIPGGKFLKGSPPTEKGRKDDEGPQHEVTIEPFWMGKHEVQWDAYEIWSFKMDVKRREVLDIKPTELDKFADIVTRPTRPYTDMSFGMGKGAGYPAICMTQLAAKSYCEWLTAKTGRYYRLPTEAEWEYACRAGTTTAYHFGDDPSKLGEYAWYYDNSKEKYQKVGLKKPNPWGLYDMHGNVAEWCLDAYDTEFFKTLAGKTTKNPLNVPKTMYPRTARGGSWDGEAADLRSAARLASSDDWSMQDPQAPRSIWYHTDALWVGFRVIRPLREPTEEEKKLYGPDKVQQNLK
jgi:formylglycine-generating enzyme required for sulfatase activity